MIDEKVEIVTDTINGRTFYSACPECGNDGCYEEGDKCGNCGHFVGSN